MPAGIRIWDGGGVLQADISSRMFRKLAVISYGAGNGSAGFSRYAEDSVLVPVAKGWYVPNFTINVGASTISWDWSSVNSLYRYGGTVEIWAF